MAITLSTHVLNLASGQPVSGLAVSLYAANDRLLSSATTNEDGRITEWPDLAALAPGIYLLTFEVETWYAAQGESCFYPQVRVDFKIDEQRHYHVPLLLNRYGYSTYRGS